MSSYLFLWLSAPALSAVLLTVLAALRSTAQREHAWLAGQTAGIRQTAGLLLNVPPESASAPDVARIILVKLEPLQAQMLPEDVQLIHRTLEQRGKAHLS